MTSTEHPSTSDQTSTDHTPQPIPLVPGRAGSTLEIAQALGIPTQTEDGQPVSRNALKRLIRERHYKLKLEQRKEHQRELRRKKRQAKRLRSNDEESSPNKCPRREEITPFDVTFVLDCAYDHLMMEKEIGSLCSQIGRCYSWMRRSTHPPAGGIVLTSYGGRLQTMMQQRHPAADRWQNVRLEKDGYEHLFDKSTLVYLSADAEQELATLEPGKVYVIGCLVDKNRYKGLTHNKATELGITTARLPIGSFVKMVQRKVLAVNHVVEILLKWCEYQDWEKAFLEVIPPRKLAPTQSVNDSVEVSESGDESDQAESVPHDTMSEISTHHHQCDHNASSVDDTIHPQ